MKVCFLLKSVREALNGMDTGKSPGIDGLTAEFYLAFWAVLGNDLVEVLNYGFQNGQLSVSQCRGLLSLIFKKGEKGFEELETDIFALC